jgi:TolB protein
MTMKKVWIVFVLASLSSGVYARRHGEKSKQVVQSTENSSSLKVEVDAHATKKRKLLLVPLSLSDASSQEVCEALKRALEYTDQLESDIQHENVPYKKKQVLALKEKGYHFVTFLTEDKDDKVYEWRLYDTNKAVMQAGFRIQKQGKIARGWGYSLADSIIPALTNNKPFACSKLTYCQTGKNGETVVYVADFDGSNPQILTQSKRQIIAPRWNRDPENPVVLYSKYTPLNIQLISCGLDGSEVVASSFDGLNMLPTFSFDGKEVVLCLSRDGSSQLYHYGYHKQLKKVGYTRLTYNSGNNICPAFLPNGDIVFCSDFELGRPQLYHMNRKDDSIERLTEGGACTSPQYCDATKKLAYSKLEKGVMQLFLYDFGKKEEKQLTFDAGHKQECTWSACGNYLAYAAVEGKNQRIVSHSLLTGKKKFLTPEGKVCTYPSWSSLYSIFPVVEQG